MNRIAVAAASFVLAAAFSSCGFGLRIGPIGAGFGVGAGPESETPAEAGGLRTDRYEVVIDVAPDLTSSGTIATTRTILSPAGVIACISRRNAA